MSTNIDDINKILDCIKKEALNLFINDLSLNIENIENHISKNHISKNHFSSIELSNNNINLIIDLDIDNDLFEIIFKKFFKNDVTEEEKKELVDALPNEIINIIVGLSIRNFPNKYKNLILGLPLQIEDKKISNNTNTKLSSFCRIVTSDGNLYLNLKQVIFLL